MAHPLWTNFEQLLMHLAKELGVDTVQKDVHQTILLAILVSLVVLITFELIVVSVRSWAVSLIGPRAYNTIVVAMIVACTSGKAYHDATDAPWLFWMASKTDPGRFMMQWVFSSVSMLFTCYILGFLAPMEEGRER